MKLYDLFQAACQLAGDERQRFLARIREEDPEQAEELKRLLESDSTEGAVPREFTRSPLPLSETPELLTGSSLDVDELRAELDELIQRRGDGTNLELGELLGAGSMGEVRRVFDHSLRRELAMKTIRAGDSATKGVRLARFLNEARILGRLDHPAIVAIHELGVDPKGRAYFTMPIVEGGDLRTAFEKARAGRDDWSLSRAVETLLRVTEAMAFAHASGVVHRDLKPTNVLVGNFGQVLVMDWGIARAFDTGDIHDLSPMPAEGGAKPGTNDSPVRTMDGAIVGTPYFMSPEQGAGRGDLVDERSDVYAVGAMLYELLCSSRPHESKAGSNAPHAVLARLATTAPEPLADRAPDAPAELVAVCEKAMARDRDDRYPTMEALARDLRAFLDGRVVNAYETGAIAELVKWVGRNRLAAGALAGVFLTLVAAAGGIAWVESVNAEHERKLSGQLSTEKEAALEALKLAERERSRAATEIDIRNRTIKLMKSIFENARPKAARGKELSATDLLDRSREVLESDQSVEPRILGELQVSLGLSYRLLGDLETSVEILTKAVENLEPALGPDSFDVLEVKLFRARSLRDLGRLADSIELNREVLRRCEAVFGSQGILTLKAMSQLGSKLRAIGQRKESNELVLEAYRRASESRGDDDDLTITMAYPAIEALVETEAIDEAATLATRVVAHTRMNSELTPDFLYALGNLGAMLSEPELERLDEAEAAMRESFDGMMIVLGPDHPDTYFASNNLGFFYLRQGRYAEARAEFELTVRARTRILGAGHVRTLGSRSRLVGAYLGLGALDQAASAAELNFESAARDATLAPSQAEAHYDLGRVRHRQSRHQEARDLLEEANRRYVELKAGTNRGVVLAELVRVHVALDQTERARERLAELEELLPSTALVRQELSSDLAREGADLTVQPTDENQ